MIYSNMIYNNKFTYLFLKKEKEKEKKKKIYIYIYRVKVTPLKAYLVDCNRYYNIIVIFIV